MGIAVRLAVTILLLGVRYSWRPGHSLGLAVQIPQTPAPCTNGSSGHRAHVLANGAIRINGIPVDQAQLSATIKELYASRAERLLFVSAEPAASMQAVTTFIDLAAAQIEVIAIVPPSLSMDTCMTVKPPWQLSP